MDNLNTHVNMVLYVPLLILDTYLGLTQFIRPIEFLDGKLYHRTSVDMTPTAIAEH